MVELALADKSTEYVGLGKLISSKLLCETIDFIIFVKHGGTCSENTYNRI